MKKDERVQDRAIEKLVASKLRGQLQPQAAGCPDAETVAAYVDGTLPARERPQWEDHFATCSRCQEQVATLVRWSEVDEPVERKVASPARPRAFAGFRWAWAAPVLLAVFVGGLWYTGEFRSRLRQTQETSIEPMSSAPAPAAPATPAASQGAGLPRTAAVKGEAAEARKAGSGSLKPNLQPRGSGSGNAADLLAAKRARKDLSLEDKSVHAVAKLAAPAPSTIPEVTARTESAPAAPAAGVAQVPMAKPSERARVAMGGLMAERGAASSLRTKEGFGSGRSGIAASSLGRAAASQEAKQAVETQPTVAPEIVAKGESKSEKQKLSAASNLAQEALVLPRANGWRVGPHGLIQTTDSRGNWITVPSGIDVDLYGISFPSEDIGWAVGQSGLILRTTDRGRTWKRITTPTSEDLIKITASSALTAQIETRGGQSWLTADGGQSWVKPLPE